MKIASNPRRTIADPPDRRLEECLRAAIAIGAVLALSLPGALGHNAAIGWMPLWLLGMPLASWWALHRFALPSLASPHANPQVRRGRLQPQARRRSRPVSGRRLRAA